VTLRLDCLVYPIRGRSIAILRERACTSASVGAHAVRIDSEPRSTLQIGYVTKR
jgi:hypothetical protein